MMHLFGSPDPLHVQAVQIAASQSGTIYQAVLDDKSLWNSDIMETIVQDFPRGLLDESDIYLALTECIANAAIHGNALALGIYARKRRNLLLLSFYQYPCMSPMTGTMLSLARFGYLPDYANQAPGGLGFPILLRLARNVTISPNYQRLQLWFQLK